MGQPESVTVATSARGKPLVYCLLGMCCWNLIVAIDSTALSVALPVSSYEKVSSHNS